MCFVNFSYSRFHLLWLISGWNGLAFLSIVHDFVFVDYCHQIYFSKSYLWCCFKALKVCVHNKTIKCVVLFCNQTRYSRAVTFILILIINLECCKFINSWLCLILKLILCYEGDKMWQYEILQSNEVNHSEMNHSIFLCTFIILCKPLNFKSQFFIVEFRLEYLHNGVKRNTIILVDSSKFPTVLWSYQSDEPGAFTRIVNLSETRVFRVYNGR